ncbi:MAG: hypothetical protein [Caudoviricetes sp.]|nr:MAG: hypothetical protein [Caudoviricetes sp.]
MRKWPLVRNGGGVAIRYYSIKEKSRNDNFITFENSKIEIPFSEMKKNTLSCFVTFSQINTNLMFMRDITSILNNYEVLYIYYDDITQKTTINLEPASYQTGYVGSSPIIMGLLIVGVKP